MSGSKIVKILSSGYEHLYDFVFPYVASVRKYEPLAELTIVDNGSPKPYEPHHMLRARIARTDNLAIMTSFNRVIPQDEWDWIMLTDTDVLCQGSFLDLVNEFDDRAIYGQQMFTQGPVQWFDGWMFCVPRRIWDDLGPFDETFKLTGAFQDLDYCLRAVKAGYELKLAHLPFKHLEANTTHGSPGFWENREFNRKMIYAKHGIKLEL